MKSDSFDRLVNIREEMLDLFSEANSILEEEAKEITYQRAHAYWLAHVQMGLTNDHDYVGGSTVSFEDTLEALEEEIEIPDDLDDDS